MPFPRTRPLAPDPIRIGLVGCGGRGTGAAVDCLRGADQIRLVAIGDLFPDRVAHCRENLAKAAAEDPRVAAGLQLTEERCFAGFEAYRQVIAADLDLVILATPPGFRPFHLAAAIKAGKNVFMEKPVAVDPVGVRSVIASSELAAKKGLAIVAGTQRRHQQSYLETLKRIHDGAIGELVGGHCYW